jgi:uncharacterized protein
VNTVHAPEFRDLDEQDVRSVLARNNVGRLAYAWGGEADIRPLHYAYANGGIYGRTAPGAKFAEICVLPARVAFEVDEIDALFDWRSVIARGTFHILSPEGPEADEWLRAVELLRRVVKLTFREGDPVPDRNLIFKIDVEEMTGRASAESR